MAKLNKIDSNSTGLRYCENVSLGVNDVPANQIWIPLEPNSYADFGGQIKTVARNPINASRQRKKGVVTDEEASGGINTDLTQTNLQNILQGFFFANLRRKTEESAVTTVTASTKKYHIVTSAMKVGDLFFATGFLNAANNGLKRVTAVDGTDVTVAETVVDETVTTTVKIVRVGFQFATGDATIDGDGASLPRLLDTTKDFTELGLIPGEWVYVGGDDAATKFATAADNGFARVLTVAAHAISFDKTAGTMVDDSAAAKTIQVFFGRVLKNELGTSIVRRSYDLERTLGANNDTDLTKQQADILVGSIPNEMTVNVPTAEKVTVDLSFVALHSTTADENTSGANTLPSKAAVVAGSAANAPALVEADAFNTSTDVSRIKLATYTPGVPNPTPLFAFVQSMTLKLNNGVTPDKAIGVVGAFEASIGTFAVTGTMTAYFADTAAVQAVQDNADITLDAHFVKANSGITFDMPLISLGNGRPTVEQDKPIVLPLDADAATGAKVNAALDYTLLMVFWDYLPNAAE